MTGSRRRTPVAKGTKCKHCKDGVSRLPGGRDWLHTATSSVWCADNLPGLTARFAEPG